MPTTFLSLTDDVTSVWDDHTGRRNEDYQEEICPSRPWRCIGYVVNEAMADALQGSEVQSSCGRSSAARLNDVLTCHIHCGSMFLIEANW
jgi:hypothetical protein